MAKKEPNLITVTSLQAADKVRVVTENGSSSRLVTVTDLATALTPIIEPQLNLKDNENAVRLESTNTGLIATDEYLELDASGGDLTLLLMNPSAVFTASVGAIPDIGQRFYIKFLFGGVTNKITVTSSGGSNIDSDTELVVFGPDDLQIGLQSIGTAWRIVN